jgi:hypothetical protein
VREARTSPSWGAPTSAPGAGQPVGQIAGLLLRAAGTGRVLALVMPNVSIVLRRQDHAERARILRRILGAFKPEDDTSADRAIRRRVGGAVIASELAAGEPSPRESLQEPRSASWRSSSQGQGQGLFERSSTPSPVRTT